MWAVRVVLGDGTEKSFADGRRHSRELGDRAHRYEYEVDPTTEALRVFRATMTCTGYNAFEGFWDPEGTREEVGYFRAHQWENVEGS